MSDKKTDFETDFEEKWAEIASKKSRSRTNNNIYERFISRVQSDEADEGDDNGTDDVKPLESAKQPSASNTSAFEPLSVSELGLFYGHDEEAEVTATEATVDFLDKEIQVNKDTSWQDSHSNDPLLDIESDDNYVAPINNATGLAETKETAHIASDAGVISQKLPIQLAAPLAVKKSTPSQNKLVSSKKPLIIGMIVGSLLIVIIVVTLIFTGVLSTATQPAAIPAVTEPASPVITSTATSTAPPTSTTDTPISADTGSTDNVAVEAQQSNNNSASQDQNAVANNAVVTEIPKTAPTAADNLNTDTAITYEDFRQESQNTLYRETDD